jgi:hypothetical protein
LLDIEQARLGKHSQGHIVRAFRAVAGGNRDEIIGSRNRDAVSCEVKQRDLGTWQRFTKIRDGLEQLIPFEVVPLNDSKSESAQRFRDRLRIATRIAQRPGGDLVFCITDYERRSRLGLRASSEDRNGERYNETKGQAHSDQDSMGRARSACICHSQSRAK